MSNAILDAVDYLDAIRIRAFVLAMAIEGVMEDSDDRDRLTNFAGQIVNDLYELNDKLKAIGGIDRDEPSD